MITDALKSLGLIPRTPSPSPPATDSKKLVALSREELVARIVPLKASPTAPAAPVFLEC